MLCTGTFTHGIARNWSLCRASVMPTPPGTKWTPTTALLCWNKPPFGTPNETPSESCPLLHPTATGCATTCACTTTELGKHFAHTERPTLRTRRYTPSVGRGRVFHGTPLTGLRSRLQLGQLGLHRGGGTQPRKPPTVQHRASSGILRFRRNLPPHVELSLIKKFI